MYKEQLRENICEVVFTKKDGTTRTMKCTTKPTYLNEHDSNHVGGGSVVPDHQIRCVDVDKNAWRSFNVDSVISFRVLTFN